MSAVTEGSVLLEKTPLEQFFSGVNVNRSDLDDWSYAKRLGFRPLDIAIAPFAAAASVISVVPYFFNSGAVSTDAGKSFPGGAPSAQQILNPIGCCSLNFVLGAVYLHQFFKDIGKNLLALLTLPQEKSLSGWVKHVAKQLWELYIIIGLKAATCMIFGFPFFALSVRTPMAGIKQKWERHSICDISWVVYGALSYDPICKIGNATSALLREAQFTLGATPARTLGLLASLSSVVVGAYFPSNLWRSVWFALTIPLVLRAAVSLKESRPTPEGYAATMQCEQLASRLKLILSTAATNVRLDIASPSEDTKASGLRDTIFNNTLSSAERLRALAQYPSKKSIPTSTNFTLATTPNALWQERRSRLAANLKTLAFWGGITTGLSTALLSGTALLGYFVSTIDASRIFHDFANSGDDGWSQNQFLLGAAIFTPSLMLDLTLTGVAFFNFGKALLHPSRLTSHKLAATFVLTILAWYSASNTQWLNEDTASAQYQPTPIVPAGSPEEPLLAPSLTIGTVLQHAFNAHVGERSFYPGSDGNTNWHLWTWGVGFLFTQFGTMFSNASASITSLSAWYRQVTQKETGHQLDALENAIAGIDESNVCGLLAELCPENTVFSRNVAVSNVLRVENNDLGSFINNEITSEETNRIERGISCC